MLSLKGILNYIDGRRALGCDERDIAANFPNEDIKEIRRLVESSADLGLFQKVEVDGMKPRYYAIDVEPVIIEPIKIKKPKTTPKEIDGINIEHCQNTRDIIDALINSETLVRKTHEFSYRTKGEESSTGRMLLDFIKTYAIDTMAKIIPIGDKNTLRKQERIVGNKIIISRTGMDQWNIQLVDYRCPDRRESINFSSYKEFEKCLRTLFTH